MSESIINLITPPDKLMNRNLSFLLVYPSDTVKEQFNDVVKELDKDINLYLFENNENQEWVIDVANIVDYIILDIDYIPKEASWLIGYLLSFSKTFYLTTAGEIPYNVINNSRVYDIRQIAEGENYFVKQTERN